MAGLTLEIAEARLTAYLTAEAAVLTGQEISIDLGNGQQKLTRADLSAIQAGITVWQKRCLQFDRGTSGLRAVGVISR